MVPFKIAIIKTGQFPVLSKFSALGEPSIRRFERDKFHASRGSTVHFWHFHPIRKPGMKQIDQLRLSSLSLSPPLFFLSLELSPASVYNWVCSCEHGLRKLNGTRSCTSYNQNCKISYAETDREGYCSSSF